MTYVEVAYGSLGKAKEQRNDRGPSHIGSLTFKQDVRAGDKVYLSAWVKTGQDGGQYFSIQAQEANQQTRSSGRDDRRDDRPIRDDRPAAPRARSSPYDDEIPFAPEFR